MRVLVQLTSGKDGSIRTDRPAIANHDNLVRLEATMLVSKLGEVMHHVMKHGYDPPGCQDFLITIQVHSYPASPCCI